MKNYKLNGAFVDERRFSNIFFDVKITEKNEIDEINLTPDTKTKNPYFLFNQEAKEQVVNFINTQLKKNSLALLQLID